MNFSRDSAIWWAGMISAALVFAGDQFGMIQEAFPNLGVLWISRIKLGAALLGMVSGYLRMSPLRLSRDSDLAGQKADPDKTLTITGQNPEEEKKGKK